MNSLIGSLPACIPFGVDKIAVVSLFFTALSLTASEFALADSGESLQVSISADKHSEFRIIVRDDQGVVTVCLEAMLCSPGAITKNIPKAALANLMSESYEIRVYERAICSSSDSNKASIFEMTKEWLVLGLNNASGLNDQIDEPSSLPILVHPQNGTSDP
jgi:hypothetical protein